MSDNHSNTTEDQFQTLSDAVVDDYLNLENADPEGEPDFAADARFKQFVLTFADNPLQATFEYWRSKDAVSDPFIREFLSRFGLEATFADLWNALEATRPNLAESEVASA